MKLLMFAFFVTCVFMLIELGLAVSASITNWIHFAQTSWRWVAVSLTYVHALLLMGLAWAVLNVNHGKMQVRI